MSDAYGADTGQHEPEQEAAPEAAPKPRPAKYWHDQLKEYKTAIEEKWKTQRDNLDKLYARVDRAESSDREYSIFWANIEVLRPAIYARTPVPVVVPRFKQTDPIASAGAEILERCLITTFEQSDIDGVMREIRDEFLRYSRGAARVRIGQTSEGIEKIEFDHFSADDFAHSVSRTWREVQWVGFRAWLTKDELKGRFEQNMAAMGLDISKVPMKKQPDMDNKEAKAPVWEIWCKKTGLVHFVAEDYEFELDTQPPWLDLSSFWPCPRPAYGTCVPNKLRPAPDILQYKDQIEEINEYTARIAALSEALRVKGFYPSGAGELSDAIETALKSLDNRATLVPVSSAAALGGTSFKDAVVWLPVKDILEIIKGLVELRRVVIDDVYQITGISDIVRGDSEASETATAQQIKSQWGSARIRERQNELARFSRDLGRIAGEIIAENFPDQLVKEMSKMELPDQQMKAQAQQQMAMAQQAQQMGQQAPPPDPKMQQMLQKPSFEEVMQFLRQDRARGFSIEIETDSTIQPDEQAEKQRRTEFVTAVGTLLKEAGPMVQMAPQLGEFVGEVLKFVAQGFRAGRPLEGAIEKLVQQLGAVANAPPQQPQPDPVQEQKIETERVKGEAAKVKATAEMQKTGMDMQRSTLEHNQSMERMQMQAMMPQQPQGPVQ